MPIPTPCPGCNPSGTSTRSHPTVPPAVAERAARLPLATWLGATQGILDHNRLADLRSLRTRSAPCGPPRTRSSARATSEPSPGRCRGRPTLRAGPSSGSSTAAAPGSRWDADRRPGTQPHLGRAGAGGHRHGGLPAWRGADGDLVPLGRPGGPAAGRRRSCSSGADGVVRCCGPGPFGDLLRRRCAADQSSRSPAGLKRRGACNSTATSVSPAAQAVSLGDVLAPRHEQVGFDDVGPQHDVEGAVSTFRSVPVKPARSGTRRGRFIHRLGTSSPSRSCRASRHRSNGGWRVGRATSVPSRRRRQPYEEDHGIAHAVAA